MKKKIKYVIVFLLILLASIMIAGSIYYKNNYPEQGFDQLVFYLFSGVEHTSPEVVNSVISDCIVPVIVIMLIIAFPITEFTKNRTYIILKIRKKEFKIKIYKMITHKKIYILIIYIIAIIMLISGFKIDEYIASIIQKTNLYDEYYVSEENVNITFPEEKRNLILIISESMENSICSIENGGGWQYSVIPELENLAKVNTNFSHTNLIGGAVQARGTHFTVAGMVALTSGTPLKIHNPSIKSEEMLFLDGVYSLGEILKTQDYNLEIMMGSEGTFGGRTQYFRTNGDYKIFDLDYAIETGKMTEQEKVWWGFEDEKLFQWSKEEITNLANQENPFNYILLTVDTHFVDGYLSEDAENKFETQYENVHAHSSKQISEFVSWIQEQDFYKNTTIVIVGDHLGMQTDFYMSHIDPNYQRTIYNCIINSAIEEQNNKNRLFTQMDMYPTILSSIGIQIEGERIGLGTNLYSGVPTLSEQLTFKYFDEELKKYSEFYNKEILNY